MINRIFALLIRYQNIALGSMPRLISIFYWPTVQILFWGFFTNYFYQINEFNIWSSLNVILSAVVLWDVLFRSQLGLSMSFFEELWSRNLPNLFITPIKDHEIIIGGYSAGAVTSLHYAYINSVDDLFLLSESDIFTNFTQEKQSFMSKFTEKKYEINKVLNIAGSLLSPYLIHEDEPSIISVHSIGDDVVPYEMGDTDGTGIISYGSKAIHQRADNLQITNNLITINDDDHASFGSGIENENCHDCRVMVDEFLSQ